MPAKSSAHRRLADTILNGRLDEFVATRRADGRSWEAIARELNVATGGEIVVVGETMRRWFDTRTDLARGA